MKVAAVIFDLFGTLVQPLNGSLLLRRLAEFGIHPAPEAAYWIARGFPPAAAVLEMGVDPVDALALHLREQLPSLVDFIKLIQMRFPAAQPPQAHTITEAEVILQVAIEGATLVDGAKPLLDWLVSQGIALRLLSNLSTPFKTIIAHFKLYHWFPHLILSCETGLLKPDPRAFERALAGLKCTAAEVMMVGDNWQSDILGALRSGLQPVFVDSTKNHPCRQLLKDASPFFEIETSGDIRFRKQLREQLRPLIPVALEAIEAAPTDHLEIDLENCLRLTPLSQVTVIDNCSDLMVVLNTQN